MAEMFSCARARSREHIGHRSSYGRPTVYIPTQSSIEALEHRVQEHAGEKKLFSQPEN